MEKIDIDHININTTRYKTKLYIESQGFVVDEEYKFPMTLGGETKTVHIRHFGSIEIDGVSYSLVRFLEEHFRQKKSTIIQNIAKYFGQGGKLIQKLSREKAERLEDLYGRYPSFSDIPLEVIYKTIRYRVQRVLSDAPEGSSPVGYPYETVDDGVVKLNEIFKPIFTDGKIPLLSKEKADRLLSREVGYNAKTKVAVRIFRNANGTVSRIVGYPASEDAYLIDFIAADEIEII